MVRHAEKGQIVTGMVARILIEMSNLTLLDRVVRRKTCTDTTAPQAACQHLGFCRLRYLPSASHCLVYSGSERGKPLEQGIGSMRMRYS